MLSMEQHPQAIALTIKHQQVGKPYMLRILSQAWVKVKIRLLLNNLNQVIYQYRIK